MSALVDPADLQDLPEVVDLGEDDRAALTRLVLDDPLVNAVVHSRLDALPSLAPRRFGGRLHGVYEPDGRLRAAAFNGGNLLPIGGDHVDWVALASHVAGQPRVCTSVVGRADAVSAFWDVLAPTWGPARAVRAAQPLLVAVSSVADRPGDVGLRAATPDDLERYLPAAVAMFQEELGVSPFVGDSAGYRGRVATLIRDRRAFCVTDDAGDIVFKADFGAVSPRTCQIQGVWVRPDLRGRGLGTAAMVGVLDHALVLAPTASLYVNDYNAPARAMYARLGMTEAAVLSTVLL